MSKLLGEEKPNPGSREAVDRGCTCPILDNNFGKGVPNKKGTKDFWYSKNCPIHVSLYN